MPLLFAEFLEQLLRDLHLGLAVLADARFAGESHDLGIALRAGNNFGTGLPRHFLFLLVRCFALTSVNDYLRKLTAVVKLSITFSNPNDKTIILP